MVGVVWCVWARQGPGRAPPYRDTRGVRSTPGPARSPSLNNVSSGKETHQTQTACDLSMFIFHQSLQRTAAEFDEADRRGWALLGGHSWVGGERHGQHEHLPGDTHTSHDQLASLPTFPKL